MLGYRLMAVMLVSMFCSLTGCATVMQTSKLPDGFAVKEIAKVDEGSPFAVNRTGTVAAVLDRAIEIVERDALPQKLVETAPSAIAFSPRGNRLAVVLPQSAEKKTILRLLDGRGNVIGETKVIGTITSMAWRSEGELLATAVVLKKFSFGSAMITMLYSWDGKGAPTATKLNDVTLRTAVAKLPEELLYKSVNLAIAPFGDEIAYSTIKDPPLFSPYQKIATHHLETGSEQEVSKTSLGSGGPIYTPDGDSLLVGDTLAMTRKLSIPDGREMNAWPCAGSYPALSPSGDYLYLDGRLYHEGREILSFPAEARASFLADGSGLIVHYGKRLYLVSGLNDKPAKPLGADLQKLLQLRRLRSQGLITEQEYRAKRGAHKEKATAR